MTEFGPSVSGQRSEKDIGKGDGRGMADLVEMVLEPFGGFRAASMVMARRSITGLCRPVAITATTIAAYTGRFSTQFMCARMAR
jgi:hypothetical protein